MNTEDIIEFRTTWNNELFFKNKSTCLAAKRLIKKSLLMVQIRLCRQLKYRENDLTKELQNIQHDRQLLNNYRCSSSLAEGLQERLKVLQNQIDNYNLQIKNLVQEEKQYWKELQQTIIKRSNCCEVTTNKLTSLSDNRPIITGNITYVTHVDKNNENIPPFPCQTSEIEDKSPVKARKIRKKTKKAY